MGLLRPIIHCLIDPEPKSFNAGDEGGSTVSFAINLNFEFPSDGTAPDITNDEAAAKARFLDFLSAVQGVQLQLYKVKKSDPLNLELEYREPLARVSETAPLGDPGDLHGWLADDDPKATTGRRIRYWATVDAARSPDVPVDAEVAAATHRLRAAQSWNAPVAHKFGLTHIVRLPADLVGGQVLAVLPYFPDANGSPAPTVFGSAIHGAENGKITKDTLFAFYYDALGAGGLLSCHTTILGEGLTKPLELQDLDPGLNADGYLTVDPDAENVRRVLNWVEERAASLMAVNPALSPPPDNSKSGDDAKPDEFEALFGIRVVDGTPPKYFWDRTAWYAVARLVSALDNILIGLLKPAGSLTSEGELLAPLVSELIKAIEEEIGDKRPLDPSLLDGARIAEAVRGVLLEASPLAVLTTPKSPELLVNALRRVYALAAPPKEIDEGSVVTALLDGYVNPAKEIRSEWLPHATSLVGHSVEAVSRALSELEQTLHEETGAEAALVRLIETVETTPDGSPPAPEKRLSALLAHALAIMAGDPTLETALRQAVERAWTAYRLVLDGQFNGAEAVRRAVGSSFIAAVLTHAAANPNPTPDKTTTSQYLKGLVTSSSFHEKRFFEQERKCPVVQRLAKSLVIPELSRIPTAAQDALRAQLKAAFTDALAAIESLNNSAARFIPDGTPQPLPIQIAADIDGSKVDQFAKHLNGIAVAIRRRDFNDDRDRWAHAHLADLDWEPPQTPVGAGGPMPARSAAATIHSMLPAISDGRGAMFIEYQGFPFADPAFDARIADTDAQPRDERRGRPFYRHDPHVASDGFAKVPRLAYGRAFETFSFVTSNAGTMPLALQRKIPPSPWMPDPEVVAPNSTPTVVGTAPYQRRTAIAQIAIVERPGSGQPGRIGATIPEVMPLASDYSRIGVQAEPNAPGVRDTFREPDGVGMMIAGALNPADEKHRAKADWRISDLQFSGTPSKLVVGFFTRQAAGPDDSEMTFDMSSVPGFPAIDEIIISVVFIDKGTPERWLLLTCGGKTFEHRLPDEGIIAGWLRLTLETAAGPATLTFADPGAHKPDNVAAPLLLLRPETGRWKTGLPKEVDAIVSTPRVGYLDFERWFANADLYQQTFITAPQESGAAHFMRALLAGYVMRHLDPLLAAAIEQLPDPAVGRIRLELTALDSLLDTNVTAVAAVTYDLADLLGDFVTTVKEPAGGWTPFSLRKGVFDPLNERFQFRLRVKSGSLQLSRESPDPADKPALPVIQATVPAGVVARLSIDALVPARHFEPDSHPSVFNSGLRQYATRSLPDSYLAFPAAALRIETMYDDTAVFVPPASNGTLDNGLAIDLAGRMISAQGLERARRFDLMTAAAMPSESETERKTLTRRWRVLGQIDVTTQRFRPSGRPIYNHVNPRAYRSAGSAIGPIKHAALPLTLDPKLALAQFELEAFFDRPDVDAHTITQCLDPLPGRTKLQEHHWDTPSATYFRHRFTLRSRYAGALNLREAREIDAWPNRKLETPAHGWTMRVAMLADLSRLLLTRPQLRALIPLTTAPGGDDAQRPAPPIAAVLQEPPFARGGLADRIACEIKTGFGYGFEQTEQEAAAAGNGNTPRVEIRDSRKEAGPKPQLDYRPLDKDIALGLVLRNEGPIGLTFDNINAPAPAFPNTMLSLRPDTLFGEAPPLEDFFAGVAMRRYIEPDWTTSDAEQSPFDGERCWWIDIAELTADLKPVEPNGAPRDLLSYEANNKRAPLLGFKRRERRIELYASKLAIDGVGGTVEDPVQILRVEERHFGDLAILHQAIAPGRYCTSVFVRTNAAKTERGQVNAPLMLASFEWSPPRPPQKPNEQTESPPPSVTLIAQAATGYQTMASAPTFLRWTKTGRDFDFVHIPQIRDDAWVSATNHVRELVAQLDHSTHDFLTFRRAGSDEPVWLRPSTFVNPHPVHVHRHLGLVTSRFLQELGRPVEVFCRTSADLDSKHHLVTPYGTTRKPDGSIFKPQEQIVRVVEFETPAAILCGSDIPVPHAYREAYFDLLATGFKLGPANIGTLRFYFRFVGPPAHLRAFTTVTLKLRPAGAKTAPDIPIELGNTAKGKFAVGLQLVLRHQGGQTKGEWTLLRSDGSRDPAKEVAGKLFTLESASNTNPGFFVSLKATPLGEFWTDISLLHSSNAFLTSPLDFGWLFSPAGEDDPAASVAPSGLNTMTEAQARVIAVSPPIPIVKH